MNALENLMISTMSIYAVTLSYAPDGVPKRSLALKNTVKCKYQVLSASHVIFTQKAGKRQTVKIFYPLGTDLAMSDIIEIKGKQYEIIGIITNDRSLTGEAEVCIIE